MRRFPVLVRGSTVIVSTPLGELAMSGAEALRLAHELQQQAGKFAIESLSSITVADALKFGARVYEEVRRARGRRR